MRESAPVGCEVTQLWFSYLQKHDIMHTQLQWDGLFVQTSCTDSHRESSAKAEEELERSMEQQAEEGVAKLDPEPSHVCLEECDGPLRVSVHMRFSRLTSMFSRQQKRLVERASKKQSSKSVETNLVILRQCHARQKSKFVKKSVTTFDTFDNFCTAPVFRPPCWWTDCVCVCV